MIQYVYDISAAVILIAFIGRGFKRGVLKTVLSLICLIIAFTAASACSSYPVASKIYDEYFSQMINERIDTAVKKVRDEASRKLKDEAKQSADKFIDDNLNGSEKLKQLVTDYLSTDDSVLRAQISEAFSIFSVDLNDLLTNQLFRDKIDSIASEYSGIAAEEINKRLPLGITVSKNSVEEVFLDEDAHEALIFELLGISSDNSPTTGAADYLENKIVGPAAIRMLSTIIWVIVFSVVSIVLKIVVSIILVVRKIEPIKACDSLLGGVLGAAAGIMVIAASVVLIVILVRITGGMTYMNEELFSKTLLFGKLYEFAKGFDFLK